MLTGYDPDYRRLPDMTRAASDEAAPDQPLPATTRTVTSCHEQ